MSNDGLGGWLERVFRGGAPDGSDDDGEAGGGEADPLDRLKDLPRRELRTRTHKAEQRFKDVRTDIEGFDDDLRKLEASHGEASSEVERKQIAMVMRVTKQKRAVKEVKEKLALRDMLKYTYVAGVSEIESIVHNEIAREDPISKYRPLLEGTVEDVPDLADQVDAEIEDLTRAFESFEQPLDDADVDVAATATGASPERVEESLESVEESLESVEESPEGVEGADLVEDALGSTPADLDRIDPFDRDSAEESASAAGERSREDAADPAGADEERDGDRESTVVRK